jgi:hypothetical protein
MSAALCETFSRELPDSWSSSFWFLDTSTSTPGCMMTLRTIFSPMKFLQSQSALLFSHPLRNPLVSCDNVPDLNLEQTGLLVVVYVDVDGEMGVDITHLVLESLCNANDQVVDESADCAESSDILAGSVVKLDVDDILLGV